MPTLPLVLAGLARLAVAASPSLAGDFTCPEAGGPAWREVRTAHFLVQTDLGSGKAQEVAREVERIYLAVRQSLRSPPEPPGLLRVVVLRSVEEFDLFARKDSDAFYRRATDGGPTVVMPGEFGEVQRMVLAHELTHHVAARVFRRQPLWFQEGLASFMETIGKSGPGKVPTLGGVPAHRHKAVYPYHGGAPALLAATGTLDEKGYGLAWALVHFLFQARPADLAQLQSRFVRGQEPAQAWREVFPEWDPARPEGAAALDEALGRHLSPQTRIRFRDVTLPPEQEVTERPLGAGDAHRIRLSLLPWLNRGEKLAPSAVRDEVEEALRHDPGHVQALTVLARLERDRAPAAAEQAVSAHPEDAGAWRLLATSLPPDAEARRLAALQKAVTLAPEDGATVNNLAWTLLATGRAGEALPLARAAVSLEPWSAAALDTHAAVLETLGACPAALSLQERACDLVGEGYPAEARKPYLDRLERLERQCGGKPAVTTAPPAPAPAAPAAEAAP